MEVRPTGHLDAHIKYVEYLIDQELYEKSLNFSILIGERAFYLDFLRGYALEKLGRYDEAVKHYEKFEEMSEAFPAPEKYRIQNSTYQNNIHFESDIEMSLLQNNILPSGKKRYWNQVP
jgi:tetratricopeptide (TPR) repeat protein